MHAILKYLPSSIYLYLIALGHIMQKNSWKMFKVQIVNLESLTLC